MELFHDNGHLTSEGLQAIVDETLDEMGRLEAAEHLGFCDDCLVRYTALLTGEVLIAPETPVKEGVMARIKQRVRRILWSKYGTVAAAAVLAVTMFSIGSLAAPMLRDNVTGRPDAGDPQTAQTQRAEPEAEHQAETYQPGIADRLEGVLSSATNGINGFFGGLIPGEGSAPKTAEDQKQQAERDKHMSLFADKNKQGDDKDSKTGQNDAGKTDNSTADPDSKGEGQ